MKHVVLAACLSCLLAACASTGPHVASNADPDTNFSAIRTFGFMQPLGTDRPGGIRTPLSSRLVDAATRELESRGMRYSEKPDVRVNFFVNLEQRLDVRQVPTASSFHGYRRGRYRPWGSYETRVREYVRGTLAVDLVDPGRKMLVWEGVAQARLGRGDVEITQEMIDGAVSAIFADLPR